MFKHINLTLFWGLFGIIMLSFLGVSSGDSTLDFALAFGALQFMHFVQLPVGVLATGMGGNGELAQQLMDSVKSWFESQKGNFISQTEIDAKLKELSDRINPDLQKLKDLLPREEFLAKLKELNDVIDAQGLIIKKLENTPPENKRKSLETVLQEFMSSGEVKEFAQGLRTSVKHETGLDLKTVARSGVMPLGGYDPQVQGVLQPRLPITHVRQVITTQPTKTATVTYLKISFTTNAIAFVAENGKLPESAFTTTTAKVDAKRIGTHIKISDNALREDPEGVIPEVYAMISDDVMSKEDYAILFGDGTTENHVGISANALDFATVITTGHRFYQKVAAAQEIDALIVAISILKNTRFRPTAIILNSDDATALTMQKSSVGEYLVRAQRENGVLLVDGIPVVELPGDIMASGKFLVGNFVNGVAIRDYSTMVIQLIKTEDDQLKNQTTLKAEFQAALPIKYANGFVKGTFTTAVAAITKP